MHRLLQDQIKTFWKAKSDKKPSTAIIQLRIALVILASAIWQSPLAVAEDEPPIEAVRAWSAGRDSMSKKDYRAAIKHYQRAIKIDGKPLKKAGISYLMDLPRAYYHLGEYETAYSYSSLLIKRNHGPTKDRNQRTHADICLMSNRYKEAIQAYKSSGFLRYFDDKVTIGLCEAYFFDKQFKKAIEVLEEKKAQRLFRTPESHAKRYYWLGRLSAWRTKTPSRRTEGKLECFSLAVKFQPDEPKYLNALAWTAATSKDGRQRDGELALEKASRLANITNDNPYYLDTLAAAYAETGDFRRAKEWQQRAISGYFKVSGGKTKLKSTSHLTKEQKALYQEMIERLELYQNKKPFRE